MKHQERLIRTVLIILAVAVPLISAACTNATGNYFSEIGAKLMMSSSCRLLIVALLIGIKQNPRTKSEKIGAIAGLTVLMLLRWL